MRNINACFYHLNAGLPEDVMRLKEAGYYQAAIELIDFKLAENWAERQNSRPYQGLPSSETKIAQNPMPSMPKAMRDAMIAQREMLALLPLHYTYTEEEAFGVLQSKIADFTEEEFHSLFNENRLDWRFVNGAPYISDNFYDTLIDTDASYAMRAGVPHTGERNAQRDAAIAKMEQTGEMQMRYTLRASIKVSDSAFAIALAQAKQAGKETVTVRAWLPFPTGCDTQSDIALQHAIPEQYVSVSPETAQARSIYWEVETEKNLNFSVEYRYTQTAYYTKLPSSHANDINGMDVSQDTDVSIAQNQVFAKDLAEQPPHGCFTPYLTSLVAELTEGLGTPLEKARAIYDYITLNVHYRYMPPYFMLENIAENCAMSRRGDCGVMAITFITMCRIAGIPAQWESGLMVHPNDAGCHDWARFYIAPYGWLYADCSYGSSAAREEAEHRRLHYFGNLDPYRMVANNTFFAPLTPPKQGWRADPCDNQCGEVELDGIGILGDDLETNVEVLYAKEQ